MADTLAHLLAGAGQVAGRDPAQLVSQAYPITQTVLIACVLLTHPVAAAFAVGVLVAGAVSLVVTPAGQPDLLVRTATYGGLAVLLWPRRDLGLLRTALLCIFGGGWLAWVGWVAARNWPAWGVMQGVRLVGTVLFLMAAARTTDAEADG